MEERVKAIANQSTPTLVKDIQVFLGFIGFYRRFIRNYAKITSLLIDLLRGQSTYTFVMIEVIIQVFKTLRKAFTTTLILKHYNPRLPIWVETDALGYTIGIVITQKYSNLQYPIAFLSRKLTPVEVNYDTIDIEFLAIIEAFRT